jgi:hypothetical protein
MADSFNSAKTIVGYPIILLESIPEVKWRARDSPPMKREVATLPRVARNDKACHPEALPRDPPCQVIPYPIEII